MSINYKSRIAISLLTISAAGFATWKAEEGTGPMAVNTTGQAVHKPYVPTKGDVPTIGFGSTYYENGQRVTMADAPITRARADQLARNLASKEEARFRATLPGVKLHSEEYDLYMNFVGQYGLGNWQKPKSPRTWLLRGEYPQACKALLTWRFQAGRDCKLPQHWGRYGCKGVWTRQLARYETCMGVQ